VAEQPTELRWGSRVFRGRLADAEGSGEGSTVGDQVEGSDPWWRRRPRRALCTWRARESTTRSLPRATCATVGRLGRSGKAERGRTTATAEAVGGHALSNTGRYVVTLTEPHSSRSEVIKTPSWRAGG